MATSRSPRQRFCLPVAFTISAERVQFQLRSLCAEDSVHPADRLFVAEVVAYRGNVDQVNPVLLAEGVFVRVPVKDCLHFPVRPDQFEKALDVEEFSVPVAERMMNKKDRRTGVRTLQVVSEPLSLRFSEEAGRF